MFDFITKAYAVKSFALDAVDFVKDRLDQIEWDRESMLHRMGLSTYRPGKAVAGSVSLFVGGIAVGALLGMVFAPRPGTEIRGQLKDKARKMMEGQRAAPGTIHPAAVAGYDQPRT